MNIRITLSFLLTAFISMSMSAQVIWGGPGDPNGEFDGGLNDWTTVGLSSDTPDSTANALWRWDADGVPNEGAYAANNLVIESPSAANGAAIFDSDFLDNGGVQGAFGAGLAPAPQVSELISPMFDCSGSETVVVSFYQRFRNFDATVFLDVSTDGGIEFESYPISPETFGNDATTFSESLYRVDITEQAANMDSVIMKFVFNGEYYYWIIDDVAVTEQADLDVAVGDIYYSADYTKIPVSQVDVVDHEFSMDVINRGRAAQYEVDVAVSITDLDLNTLFSDSLTIDTLFVDDTLSVLFDTIVNAAGMPFGEIGEYNLIYEVLPSDDDFSDRDNLAFERFAITENQYSIDNEDFQYWSVGDDFIGNYYETGNWEDSGTGSFTANTMYISATDGGGGNTVAELGGAVFRINDDVLDDFSNFDNNADLSVLGDHPSVTPVGYIFATLDDADRSIFALDLIDFETDEPGITLMPNSRYIFMVQRTTSEDLFYGFERYIDFFQISTVDYSLGDRFYAGGVGADFAFGGAVEIAFTSSTNEIELPASTLSVFPNPAYDNFNVELDFEEVVDVTLLLTGIDGKIFRMENLSDVTRLNKTFDTSDLASGTYIVRVLTENGIRNQKLVIQK